MKIIPPNTHMPGKGYASRCFQTQAEVMRFLQSCTAFQKDKKGEKKRSIKSEVLQIERKVGQFLDRIINTDSPILINSYESQARQLEEQKISLNEKVQNCGRPLQSFDETFRTAFGFLSNPCKLWKSDRLEDKRSVLKLVFAKRLPYYRNEGFRTAALSLPFSLSGFTIKGR